MAAATTTTNNNNNNNNTHPSHAARRSVSSFVTTPLGDPSCPGEQRRRPIRPFASPPLLSQAPAEMYHVVLLGYAAYRACSWLLSFRPGEV